jgi:methionine synthase I (cobalamin-dependent)
MGTMLHKRGAARPACPVALNLQHPEWVFEIHRAYASAGCDLLETNTFGANAFKLATVGLQDQLTAINTAGVRLARQAAQDSGRAIWVAGSLGPLGVRLVPSGRVKADSAGLRRPGSSRQPWLASPFVQAEGKRMLQSQTPGEGRSAYRPPAGRGPA